NFAVRRFDVRAIQFPYGVVTVGGAAKGAKITLAEELLCRGLHRRNVQHFGDPVRVTDVKDRTLALIPNAILVAAALGAVARREFFGDLDETANKDIGW